MPENAKLVSKALSDKKPLSHKNTLSTEAEIDLGYMCIRGKFWGPEDGEPTIALHGYLDNANSFDQTAPLLPNLRIFAMDFAGHGHSDHRRDGEQYTGLNDIKDILAVADHLGWETFNIIGHSMGAEIGSQLTGLFPQRVSKLACIDGFCGTNEPAQTLDHIRSNISSSFRRSSNLKVFDSLEAMNTRLRQATGQNEASAGCLIKRGHKVVEGGVTWVTDPRIKGSGPFELAKDQYHQLLDQIMAETLFIVADRDSEWLQRILREVEPRNDANITVVDLPGHHHVHMQERAPEVAKLIQQFMVAPESLKEPQQDKSLCA